MSRGVSLIELLVVVAILAVVVTVFLQSLIDFVHTRAAAEAQQTVESSLRTMSEALTRDVEGARAASVGSSTLTLSTGTTTIVYTLASSTLVRSVGSSTAATHGARVRVNAFEPVLYPRYNEVYNATTTEVAWHLVASFIHSAPEYQYTGERAASAMLRQ